MKMKKCHLLLLIGLLSVSVFIFTKFGTDVYVGNYSWDCFPIDVRVAIDDKQLLDDSLYCKPYMPAYHVREKLKYGFHTIRISSTKLVLNQEQRIFLLPNQHIAIEFLASDSLLERGKCRNNAALHERDNLFRDIDSLKIVPHEKSRFLIETNFNPFYVE